MNSTDWTWFATFQSDHKRQITALNLINFLHEKHKIRLLNIFIIFKMLDPLPSIKKIKLINNCIKN